MIAGERPPATALTTVVLAVLCVSSCHFLASQPEVIAAGYYTEAGIRHACYWKNRELHDLPCSTNPATELRAIVFAANTVQVGGIDYDTPCLWKESRLFPLPVTSPPLIHTPRMPLVCRVFDMKLVGNTTYTLGYYDSTDGNAYYCVWKDMVPVDLNFTQIEAPLRSLAVSQGDIFVAGLSVPLASTCYWKNGALVPLPPPADGTAGMALSIAVRDGIPYTAGHFVRGVQNFPCYWTGNAVTELSLAPDAIGGGATAVFVLQGDVYTAGNCDGGFLTTLSPCYWKNSVRVDLPRNGSNESEARAIFVH